jgi:hypothetical protein
MKIVYIVYVYSWWYLGGWLYWGGWLYGVNWVDGEGIGCVKDGGLVGDGGVVFLVGRGGVSPSGLVSFFVRLIEPWLSWASKWPSSSSEALIKVSSVPLIIMYEW